MFCDLKQAISCSCIYWTILEFFAGTNSGVTTRSGWCRSGRPVQNFKNFSASTFRRFRHRRRRTSTTFWRRNVLASFKTRFFTTEINFKCLLFLLTFCVTNEPTSASFYRFKQHFREQTNSSGIRTQIVGDKGLLPYWRLDQLTLWNYKTVFLNYESCFIKDFAAKVIILPFKEPMS